MTIDEACRSEARARKAAAQARWRRRRRGEAVPKLKPGPRPVAPGDSRDIAVRDDGGEEAVDV